MSTELLSSSGDQMMLEAGTASFALTGPWRTLQLLLKRLLDVLVAVALLLALLPLLWSVALLVRLSSPGPVLFCQPRVGHKGKVFYMLKFRTMVRDSEPSLHQAYYESLVNGTAEPVQGTYKLVDDPRITRMGRRLRRFSADELPQLWNVIRGDMSLVGPRPPLTYEVELYGPRERQRLDAKPGLTGLWQVSGRSALTFEEMIDLDVYYVEHWSIWLDIWILLRTPSAVLGGKGV